MEAGQLEGAAGVLLGDHQLAGALVVLLRDLGDVRDDAAA